MFRIPAHVWPAAMRVCLAIFPAALGLAALAGVLSYVHVRAGGSLVSNWLVDLGLAAVILAAMAMAGAVLLALLAPAHALPGGAGFPRLRLRRESPGLALFDVILAVGIIGILIAGGVLLLQNVQERIRRNDTISLINQMRSEAQRIFAGQPDFTGLDMKALETRGSLPDYVIRSGTSGTALGARYMNAYDGWVFIWPETGVKQFTIGVGGLDQGPCVDVMTPYTQKTRTVSGLVAMGVKKDNDVGELAVRAWDGSTWAPHSSGASGAASSTGITLATAQGWCGDDDGKNAVYFRFQG